jgi:uncharacterized protein YndB with AHSA1/START domain
MPHEFEIRRTVPLPASPDQVWEAIATPAGLAGWFMPMPIDPAGAGVKVWEPGKRLLVEPPAGADGSTQAFEYLIEGRDGGTTVLRFVHSGFLGGDWNDEFEAMTGAGWDMYLHTLSQYLAYFAGRSTTYVEADGPASSAAPDGWAALIAAVGGGTDPQVGVEVRIALPSAEALAGVIDYRSGTFLGLRTADALIRFHGRAPIGMTVAVSHHAYRDLDAAATARAWREWLAAIWAVGEAE